MKKSYLKAIFINAKATGAKYIGVRIETEGSSRPECIINPRENFDAKYDYYMQAYDDDLRLIATKGKKDIRITGIAQGDCFEDIEYQIIAERGQNWKEPISDAIERVYEKMIKETPPKTEEERLKCEQMKETIKGMFLNSTRTAAEARFIFDNLEKYEELFEICMNGDELQFKKGIVELQRMQNEYILQEEKKREEELNE